MVSYRRSYIKYAILLFGVARALHCASLDSWLNQVYSLFLFSRVKTLLSTDAGAMGVDVETTRLVVICSATSTTSGFQQEVDE